MDEKTESLIDDAYVSAEIAIHTIDKKLPMADMIDRLNEAVESFELACGKILRGLTDEQAKNEAKLRIYSKKQALISIEI
jgi:hypothetical protein